MTTITLTKLAEEGKLSIGDTLTHSEIGHCTLIAVVSTQTILVKDSEGQCHKWTVDFGPDARIVEVPRSKA